MCKDLVMQTSGPAAPHGRRERKKQATRRALQQAALRLSLDHDVDQVTVEAICREADVAPRTFFNHFATKDEALAGDPPPLPTRAQWEVFTANTDGDLWTDLRNIVESSVRDFALRKDELRARRELAERYPNVLQRMRAHFHDAEREMIVAIAKRTGTDPDTDLYPRVVAGLAETAMRVAVQTWSNAQGERPIDDYLREAFELVAKGP